MSMKSEYQIENCVDSLEDHAFVLANQVEVLRHALRECAEHIESAPGLTMRGVMLAHAARQILKGEYQL